MSKKRGRKGSWRKLKRAAAEFAAAMFTFGIEVFHEQETKEAVKLLRIRITNLGRMVICILVLTASHRFDQLL